MCAQSSVFSICAKNRPWSSRRLAQKRCFQDLHEVSWDVLSQPRTKLPELMGAIERMEHLVRRYCGRRDAQRDPHTLADDIRMGSLQDLLPERLENHVQLNRAKDHRSKKDKTNKGGSKWMGKTKNTTDAHNLASTMPANNESDMLWKCRSLNEIKIWIKIWVGAGAGKTGLSLSVTWWKGMLVMWTSLSILPLENFWSRENDWALKCATMVIQNQRSRCPCAYAYHCRLSVSPPRWAELQWCVGDLFHKGTCVAKSRRRSAFHDITVAQLLTKNSVYAIYTKFKRKRDWCDDVLTGRVYAIVRLRTWPRSSRVCGSSGSWWEYQQWGEQNRAYTLRKALPGRRVRQWSNILDRNVCSFKKYEAMEACCTLIVMVCMTRASFQRSHESHKREMQFVSSECEWIRTATSQWKRWNMAGRVSNPNAMQTQGLGPGCARAKATAWTLKINNISNSSRCGSWSESTYCFWQAMRWCFRQVSLMWWGRVSPSSGGVFDSDIHRLVSAWTKMHTYLQPATFVCTYLHHTVHLSVIQKRHMIINTANMLFSLSLVSFLDNIVNVFLILCICFLFCVDCAFPLFYSSFVSPFVLRSFPFPCFMCLVNGFFSSQWTLTFCSCSIPSVCQTGCEILCFFINFVLSLASVFVWCRCCSVAVAFQSVWSFENFRSREDSEDFLNYMTGWWPLWTIPPLILEFHVPHGACVWSGFWLLVMWGCGWTILCRRLERHPVQHWVPSAISVWNASTIPSIC